MQENNQGIRLYYEQQFFFTANKGWFSNQPGKSCKDILDSGYSRGDGEYWIDPENNGNPLSVYCDMTTDGGKCKKLCEAREAKADRHFEFYYAKKLLQSLRNYSILMYFTELKVLNLQWNPSLLRSRSGRSHVTLPVPTRLLQTDIHSFLGVLRFCLLGPMSLSFSCHCIRCTNHRREHSQQNESHTLIGLFPRKECMSV